VGHVQQCVLCCDMWRVCGVVHVAQDGCTVVHVFGDVVWRVMMFIVALW